MLRTIRRALLLCWCNPIAMARDAVHACACGSAQCAESTVGRTQADICRSMFAECAATFGIHIRGTLHL